MMYYIERPSTWAAANRKQAELLEYIAKFRNCLIADELSRDAMVAEIRHRVDELNLAYPKTKELAVRTNVDGDYLECKPKQTRFYYDYVFTIRFHPVMTTYKFSEKVTLSEENSETKGA